MRTTKQTLPGNTLADTAIKNGQNILVADFLSFVEHEGNATDKTMTDDLFHVAEDYAQKIGHRRHNQLPLQEMPLRLLGPLVRYLVTNGYR